jgi:hypothetical protein
MMMIIVRMMMIRMMMIIGDNDAVAIKTPTCSTAFDTAIIVKVGINTACR